MSAATFTTLGTRLSAAQADLATRAATIATAATAVAALATTAVGSETSAERVARLRLLLDSGLGTFAAAASVAQGLADGYRNAIQHDLDEIQGGL